MIAVLRRARSLPESVLLGAAGAGGASLGVLFAVVAVLRRSKPLHPAGVVAPAVLEVEPAAAASGSSLLDTAGVHPCLVRASYAVGTGPQLPDFEGFALRVRGGEETGEVADVLFASTGVGVLGRHLLLVRSPRRHASQTTLLPVRAGGRPLLVRLDPRDAGSQPWPAAYDLSWAHGAGRWHRFGSLRVEWGAPADAPERFDPVAHPLTGTTQYRAVAWLREPAYRLSRVAWPRAGRLRESLSPAGGSPRSGS